MLIKSQADLDEFKKMYGIDGEIERSIDMSILGNILWKAVFQNCKVIPDAIWRRGNLTGRRAFL